MYLITTIRNVGKKEKERIINLYCLADKLFQDNLIFLITLIKEKLSCEP